MVNTFNFEAIRLSNILKYWWQNKLLLFFCNNFVFLHVKWRFIFANPYKYTPIKYQYLNKLEILLLIVLSFY